MVPWPHHKTLLKKKPPCVLPGGYPLSDFVYRALYRIVQRRKGKTLGQKQVEEMMGTRKMSNEERKQSKKKNKQEMKGPDDTHRNLT